MVTVLILAPLALLLAVVVLALVTVRRSMVRIDADGVAVHNFGQAPRTVPLTDVVRFETMPTAGSFAGLRPATALLVLRDGSRIVVRTVRDESGAVGVDALNARLDAVRAAG